MGGMEIQFGPLVFQTVALLITAYLLPRFEISGPISAFIMVVVIGIVNSTLWDAALFYSIPNSITAQTVTTLAVNAVLFWILAKVLPGVQIHGILPALVAPVVFTVISIATYQLGRDVNWHAVGTGVQGGFDFLKNYIQRGGATPPH